ncbi:MAG: hypothetical protein RL757_3405, partial [Bacteroidota bacterium]
LFFTVSNDMMMYAYAILGILTPIFYPIYAKRRYYNHCKKFIAETYKDRLDEPRKIIFDENGIYCFDDYSETKMKFSIIENITETNQYFYLKIKGSQSLIIPKSNVADVDVVKTHLKALADKLKIDYIKNIK